jgi:citrate synthase
MNEPRYMSAREAARALNVTPATLYSYVSRGLIRSEETTGARRERRYRAEDVMRLKERKELRRDPAKAARGALHTGAPVMESAITLIADGRLYYRGHDAVELARARRTEEVAGLIWYDDLATEVKLAARRIEFPPRWETIGRGVAELTTVERLATLMPIAGAGDPGGFDLRPRAVRLTGAKILGMMVATAAGGTAIAGSAAETLARAWAPGKRHARELIDAAMILAADHELNVSSFTVRCVASAGSTPYAAVGAGLAAMQGTKHGGYTERVEMMLREIGRPEGAREVIAGRLRRGESIPGFGHGLYPTGDPRGRALIAMTAEAFPRSPATKLVTAVAREVESLTGDHPTIDLGLVLLARALALPPGSPLTLFTLGRTIGWIGHAIEQYETDRMIRPRALYTGRMPEVA